MSIVNMDSLLDVMAELFSDEISIAVSNTTEYTPRPEHKAIPGFVYGGLLASLVDCHGTGSASLALHRKNGHEPGDGEEPPRFVTASLQIDFMKPTPQHVPLKVVGTVEEVHPKKWKVHTEVFANETCVVKGTVVAAILKSFIEQVSK